MVSKTEKGTAGWNTNLLIGASINGVSDYVPSPASSEIARPMNNKTTNALHI
jgi:hypothetical protein